MTKHIPLTQSKFALVDDDMFDEVACYKWQAQRNGNTYYAGRTNNRVSVTMHRQVLGLKHGDGKIVDHINRDGLDNRRANLQVANYMINGRNHGNYKSSTSGYAGVNWHKVQKKWQARLRVNGEQVYLGVYSDIEDAIEARRQGELRYW